MYLKNDSIFAYFQYDQLCGKGNFSREDIVTVLTANQGNVEAAFQELNKVQLKPFLMRIWGQGDSSEVASGQTPTTSAVDDASNLGKNFKFLVQILTWVSSYTILKLPPNFWASQYSKILWNPTDFKTRSTKIRSLIAVITVSTVVVSLKNPEIEADWSYDLIMARSRIKLALELKVKVGWRTMDQKLYFFRNIWNVDAYILSNVYFMFVSQEAFWRNFAIFEK